MKIKRALAALAILSLASCGANEQHPKTSTEAKAGGTLYILSDRATNPFDPRVHCALADAYGKLPPADRPPAATLAREQGFCRTLAEGE